MVDAAVAYPQIAQRLTWQGIPFAPWKNLYQTYVAPLGSPSTGWIGEWEGTLKEKGSSDSSGFDLWARTHC